MPWILDKNTNYRSFFQQPEQKIITLVSTDFTGYTNPIELLPNLSNNQFYDVQKIVWKMPYNSTPYNFTGSFFFKIGDERIGTLQADSLSSPFSVACVSNANICKDKDCPLIVVGEGVKLEISGSAIINGNSSVDIHVYYLIDMV